MKKKDLLLVISAVLICAYPTFAQRTFKVSIEMPTLLNTSNIRINYDNGVEVKEVLDTFKNNKLILSDIYYSKYAIVTIVGGNTVKQYFIGEKPANIYLFVNETDKDPLQNVRLTNVIDIFETESSKKRAEFSKIPLEDMDKFWVKNVSLIGKVDSVNVLLQKKAANVMKSDLEFVAQNNKDYFSFWFFRASIVPWTLRNSDKLNAERNYAKLLNVFNTFPDSLKNTKEGEKVKGLLTGFQSPKLNTQAPDFLVKDINAEPIALSNFRGKYLMLVFWATWCPPCMQEVPIIKRISYKYNTNDLAIVSVSLDRDFDKFKKAINSNKMNWTHIYNHYRPIKIKAQDI